MPFVELAQKTSINTRKLGKLLEILSKKDLLIETKLKLSPKAGKKARVAIITQDGITALGHSQPKGKGGNIHQYFQRVLKAYAEKQGYQVIIEKHLNQQKAVDLHLEKGIEKTAIEISVTSDSVKELKNIQKCLAGGYDKVILLCLNKQTMDNTKKRVNNSIDKKYLGNVFITPINQIFQHI